MRFTYAIHPDPQQAIRLMRNVIQMLTKANFTPSTHPLLALNRIHQTLLIASMADGKLTQSLLDDTIKTAAQTVAGLSQILRPGHPVRAIAIAELGKLLAVDEPEPASTPANNTFPPSGPKRLKLAMATLRQAMDELCVGFGRENGGGETGKDVRDLLANVEKELDVWNGRTRDALEDSLIAGKN